MNQFDLDIALTPNGDNTFEVQISDSWQINVGPNGGYIAAILLNAIKTGIPGLSTRSFTCHFLSPSVAGPAQLELNVEKLGRTVSSATVRLCQKDKTIAVAIASMANARPQLQFNDIQMPQVAAPEATPENLRMKKGMALHAPFRDKYEQRIAIGPLFPNVQDKAQVGGWVRFKQQRAFDELALLAISDSWYPSLMARVSDEVHAPTIDHTVHFVGPTTDEVNDEFVLVMFETQNASDGFLIEDGYIWNQAGELLLRSQQLAIILPRR